MKCVPSVCLITATFVTGHLLLSRTQSPNLQKGVTVQMAVTTNAQPMPEADYNDAWVVAVTADGSLYLGADKMTPEALTDWMKTHPRNREAKLFIKADARASFASVEQALDAARTDMFQDVVLLTAQHDAPAPGVMVPPKGLDVILTPSASATTIVQLHNSSHQQPMLTINNQETPWSELASKLRETAQVGNVNSIRLESGGHVPFAQVAAVIDACRSTGATVTLASSGI
jgi:biopolymer transport protein TolR